MQPPAARTRPIQKFAAAASKCSAEVRLQATATVPFCSTSLTIETGRGIWKMHRCRLQRSAQGQMRRRVYEAQGLLHCTCISSRLTSSAIPILTICRRLQSRSEAVRINTRKQKSIICSIFYLSLSDTQQIHMSLTLKLERWPLVTCDTQQHTHIAYS